MRQALECDQSWHYFLGRTGNLNDYPRIKCQWYSEENKVWQKCYEMDSVGIDGRQFLLEQKYRIKKTDMPK